MPNFVRRHHADSKRSLQPADRSGGRCFQHLPDGYDVVKHANGKYASQRDHRLDSSMVALPTVRTHHPAGPSKETAMLLRFNILVHQAHDTRRTRSRRSTLLDNRNKFFRRFRSYADTYIYRQTQQALVFRSNQLQVQVHSIVELLGTRIEKGTRCWDSCFSDGMARKDSPSVLHDHV